MVRLLVARGSDVNARDANGTHTRTEPLPRLLACTAAAGLAAANLPRSLRSPRLAGRAPIHQAVLAGMAELAELLLEAGADPSFGCKAIGMANNVLHQAVNQGDEPMVRLPLPSSQLSSPLSSRRSDSLTLPPIRAYLQVRLLLRAAPHLDVDTPGQNGMTPLCLAVRSNREACAKALVEGGAEPRRVVTSTGKSAVDIARTNKRAAILRLFGEEA